MVESRNISEIMADLADADRVVRSDLAELAGLTREQMDEFRMGWTEIAPERRLAIVRHLVEMSEDNVELNFESIFRVCLKDKHPDVRSSAIEGLWENEATSLIGPLVDMLASDASDKVRAAAAAALGKFTMLAEHGRLRAGHLAGMHGELQHALNDENSPDEVRQRALESLAPLSTPEVTAAIEQAYMGTNPRLRVSALYAMGKNCSLQWLPTLIKELSSEDAEIRFEAARSLGELGNEGAVPSLIQHGADADAEVQTAILEALGKIGGRKAREYLQSCLNSRSRATRDAALEALEELRAKDDPLSFQL